MRIHLLVAIAAVFTLLASSADAGPCTDRILEAQAALDAKVETAAGRAPAAPESLDARLHHQPTPASIAAAERRLGMGSGGVDAAAALDRAREADERGDAQSCERALTDAQRALGN